MISNCLTDILPVEGLADFWPLQKLEWHSNDLLCPHTEPLELTFRRCSATKMFYQILHFPVSDSILAQSSGSFRTIIITLSAGIVEIGGEF